MSLLDKDKVWLLCLSHFFCWRSHLMKANFLLLCTALKKEFIFSDTALPSFAFHTQLGDKRRHKMLLLWWNSSVVSNVFHYHTSHANRPKWDFTFLKDRFRSTRSAGISAKIEISLLQSNFIPDKSQSAVVNGGLPKRDIHPTILPSCPAWKGSFYQTIPPACLSASSLWCHELGKYKQLVSSKTSRPLYCWNTQKKIMPQASSFFKQKKENKEQHNSIFVRSLFLN